MAEHLWPFRSVGDHRWDQLNALIRTPLSFSLSSVSIKVPWLIDQETQEVSLPNIHWCWCCLTLWHRSCANKLINGRKDPYRERTKKWGNRVVANVRVDRVCVCVYVCLPGAGRQSARRTSGGEFLNSFITFYRKKAQRLTNKRTMMLQIAVSVSGWRSIQTLYFKY